MSLKKHIQIAKRNTIITPRLHGWLNKNPDGIKIADPEIAQRVLKILEPSKHDRSGSFHPSQLYQCQRRQMFEYLGMSGMKSYNPTLQNLFNDGHFRHLRWQIMLLNAGILTDIEVAIKSPEYRLTGSMDGMNSNEGWMFELKGTSQFQQVMQRGAMPAHVKQVHAYLMASGLESALIVYECKSSQQWAEIEIKKDPAIIDEIETILQELNDALDSGELPEVLNVCKDQEGSTFNNCPFSSVCFGMRNIEHVVEVVSSQRGTADNRGNASRNRSVRRSAPRKGRATD